MRSGSTRALLTRGLLPRVLLPRTLLPLVAVLAGGAALAADLPYRDLDGEAQGGAGRGRTASSYAIEGRTCTLADITPQYGPVVPTNSVCDPTYVGSAAGLNRPSYDGTIQPPAFRAFAQP